MVLSRAFLILAAALVFLRAQPANPDPQKLFNLVRPKIAALVSAAPNYTCVETVVRSRLRSNFQSRGGCEQSAFTRLDGTYKNVEHDRLRLDVGVGEHGEVFSWHGQRNFITSDLTQLVSGLAISSGSFFGFVDDIFIGGRGRYFYHGLAIVNGKELAAFSYVIPRAVSHFSTNTPSGKQVMGFHGEFTADPKSGDLASITVESEDIPKEIRACQVSQTITYQNLLLNGKSFRIPETVQFVSALEDHDRLTTLTRYTGCHEFVGQSIIHFNTDPKAIIAAATPTSSLPALPRGLRLKVRLASPIDSDSAWTGDAVSGTLENTLHDKHGHTLAPKGALLTGRIVQLEHFATEEDQYWILAFRFDRLHTPTADYRLGLELKSDSGALPYMTSHRGLGRRSFEVFTTQSKDLPDTGSFRIPGDHLKLDQHFTTEWESVKPSK